MTGKETEHRQPPRRDSQRDSPSQWERRRRLAEVFGDVLPETTSDERDEPGDARARGEGRGDRWLEEQVPPHHG